MHNSTQLLILRKKYCYAVGYLESFYFKDQQNGLDGYGIFTPASSDEVLIQIMTEVEF